MSFNSDIQKSSVQGLITLYELDARKLGGDVYRFHGHNHEDNNGIIIWRGNRYHPISITAEGLEMRGDGRASMPRLKIANVLNGVVGAIGNLCLRYYDFADAKLTIITTLAAYLDDATEDNYKIQHWYIEQKINEDIREVEFELANPVDLQSAKIPLRPIDDYCRWAVCGRYRGEECGYRGTAMFDDAGNPTDDPTKDKCRGVLAHCQIRNNEDSFGGFPGSSLL